MECWGHVAPMRPVASWFRRGSPDDPAKVLAALPRLARGGQTKASGPPVGSMSLDGPARVSIGPLPPCLAPSIRLLARAWLDVTETLEGDAPWSVAHAQARSRFSSS